MNWRSKLDRVRELVPTREDLLLEFECAASGAPPSFTDQLMAEHPSLPSEYLDFLRYSDGAQLGTFVLAGSGQSAFPSISSLIRSWRESVDTDARLPIGEDAGGAVFLLEQRGAITLVDTEAAIAPERVASSFEEFIGDVLMGHRYVSLFPKGTYPDDKWFDLLTAEGWA